MMKRHNFEIPFIIFTCIIACNAIYPNFVRSMADVRGMQQLVAPQALRPVQLKSLLDCYDQPLRFQITQHGNYWVLKNLIRGRLSKRMGCATSITYTTHGDITFIKHVQSLAIRWMGPISFAIFAPGYDFKSAMESIQYVRNCLSLSRLIRDYVTFHIYFPNDHMPPLSIPLSEEEAFEWPFDCQTISASYAFVQPSDTYKVENNLTYPINVGRNIARKAANTYFILASDMELYPNVGFINQFLRMAVNNISAVLYDAIPRVFPLPVFELDENALLPETKEQLVAMLQTKIAIPFHYYVCYSCHVAPNQNKWVTANHTDEMQVFAVGKRYKEFALWEPFYVSDNKEPDFDERVTWEGQSNKRIQNYAMCLMDYEYHVLNLGFLVHAPGIKIFDATSPRLRYVPAMNEMISRKIIPEYKILYGENDRCQV